MSLASPAAAGAGPGAGLQLSTSYIGASGSGTLVTSLARSTSYMGGAGLLYTSLARSTSNMGGGALEASLPGVSYIGGGPPPGSSLGRTGSYIQPGTSIPRSISYIGAAAPPAPSPAPPPASPVAWGGAAWLTACPAAACWEAGREACCRRAAAQAAPYRARVAARPPPSAVPRAPARWVGVYWAVRACVLVMQPVCRNTAAAGTLLPLPGTQPGTLYGAAHLLPSSPTPAGGRLHGEGGRCMRPCAGGSGPAQPSSTTGTYCAGCRSPCPSPSLHARTYLLAPSLQVAAGEDDDLDFLLDELAAPMREAPPALLVREWASRAQWRPACRLRALKCTNQASTASTWHPPHTPLEP